MKTRIIFFASCLVVLLLGTWFASILGDHYFPSQGAAPDPHPYISLSIAYWGSLLALPQLPFMYIGEWLRTNTVFPIAPHLEREILIPIYSVISAGVYTLVFHLILKEIKSNKASAANSLHATRSTLG